MLLDFKIIVASLCTNLILKSYTLFKYLVSCCLHVTTNYSNWKEASQSQTEQVNLI